MNNSDTRILSNVERLLEAVRVGLWTWDGSKGRLEMDVGIDQPLAAEVHRRGAEPMLNTQLSRAGIAQ